MLEYLKKDICRIGRKAQHEGLCKHKSGNFSIRDIDSDLVVVSPTGIDRDELNVRDVIVMDLEGKVIENLSNLKPSSEALMHLQIYKEFPRIASVVHTHSKYATAFAVIGKTIPAIVFEISLLGLKVNYVPVARYCLPGTVDLAKSVTKTLLLADSILMERHGVVCVGESIDDAYLKSAYLEELAEIYNIALNLNGGVEPKQFTIDEFSAHTYPSQIKI